jgi:hypothetical protein
MRNVTQITPIKPTYKADIESKIENMRELSRKLKHLEKLYNELKTEVIEEMGNLTEAHNSYGNIIATYTEHNRSVFDKDAFNADHPGIYDKYVTTTTNKVFRLK